MVEYNFIKIIQFNYLNNNSKYFKIKIKFIINFKRMDVYRGGRRKKFRREFFQIKFGTITIKIVFLDAFILHLK